MIHTLARCNIFEIQKYFESDKGKLEFARWKEKQKQKGEPNKSSDDIFRYRRFLI